MFNVAFGLANKRISGQYRDDQSLMVLRFRSQRATLPVAAATAERQRHRAPDMEDENEEALTSARFRNDCLHRQTYGQALHGD
jgi:hypothetical protein